MQSTSQGFEMALVIGNAHNDVDICAVCTLKLPVNKLPESFFSVSAASPRPVMLIMLSMGDFFAMRNT